MLQPRTETRFAARKRPGRKKQEVSMRNALVQIALLIAAIGFSGTLFSATIA